MVAHFATVVYAAILAGSARGTVVDPSGAGVAGAAVVLRDPATGLERKQETGRGGRFELHDIPFGLYQVSVVADGFRTATREVSIRSSLPLTLTLQLELAGPRESVTVRAETPLVDPGRITTTTRLGESLLRRTQGARPGAGIQDLIATAPGFATEDNGLLHARGVDDGFLFVSDGVPMRDRVDTFFANALDTGWFETIEILEGHLPAEYGLASGGVIQVVPKSGLGAPWNGSVSLSAGSKRTGELATSVGGSIAETLGLFAALSYGGSGARYLDPVDPENFNNRGALARFLLRLDWQPAPGDRVIANLSAGGSDFRVTNTLEQELAGQRQRQSLRDAHGSVVWQRSWSSSTLTELRAYRHRFRSELTPSAGDTPISASQDRRHTRQGVLASLTHAAGKEHVLAAGADFQLVRPRERFSFFVTGEDGVAETARRFGRDHPFTFEDAARRGQASFYLQDTFSWHERLTVNAGLRFDWTSVLVSESQWSPRVGAAYFLPATGTTVRASYNRLFMPPQIENLLLSSSTEARVLSPFAVEGEEGGAPVRAERQHALEIGFIQPLGTWAVLDAAYWRRGVRSYADPNVFLGTTVIFPNSVAKGTASGVDARIVFPLRRGFSGFVSYGNALVYQEGPINGGLFLEDDVLEIGPGTRFIPDHDQRNVASLGVTYGHASTGLWLSARARHESGTPLEVGDDDLDEIRARRGAELVDFDRGRVRARTLLDLSAGLALFSERRLRADVQVDVRNVAGARFAYNFANPFSGTHFGHPRLVNVRVRLTF